MYKGTYIYNGDEDTYCGISLRKGSVYWLDISTKAQTDFCKHVAADLFVMINTSEGSAECPYTYDGFNSVWVPI